MRRLLARILQFLGILRFDLLARPVAAYPASGRMPTGELVLVKDGEIDKWACLGCPGGCGKMIALSLNPTRRPRWRVTRDDWDRPTVEPSVNQINDCGCHFWITEGRVEWCKDGRPRSLR